MSLQHSLPTKPSTTNKYKKGNAEEKQDDNKFTKTLGYLAFSLKMNRQHYPYEIFDESKVNLK